MQTPSLFYVSAACLCPTNTRVLINFIFYDSHKNFGYINKYKLHCYYTYDRRKLHFEWTLLRSKSSAYDIWKKFPETISGSTKFKLCFSSITHTLLFLKFIFSEISMTMSDYFFHFHFYGTFFWIPFLSICVCLSI